MKNNDMFRLNVLIENIKFCLVCNKVIVLLFLLTALLFSNNFDKDRTIRVGIQYGQGNYFSYFGNHNFADQTNYSEFLIDVERNVYKQGGIILLFNALQNRESGYGTCEAPILRQYNVVSNAYLASASFYINWEYVGFRFGLLTYRRERGFCEDSPKLEGVYPTFDFKVGIINRFYLIASGPNDFVSSDLFVGLNYHFEDYFSQISIGKLIEERSNDLYSLKIQFLLSEKYIVSTQGFVNFIDNLKSFRVGIGYVFRLAD